MAQAPTTLLEAIQHFSDPEVCREFVVSMRWPNGVACPRCGSLEVTWLPSVERWNCKAERRQFSVKVGTIFEDSPISLSKWLPAVWLIASAKNGISSYELSRSLGVTQKSAWFMLHRIRFAMQEGTIAPFRGTVEVDETFIGGKAKFMHKNKRAERITGTGGKDKTAVMGFIERAAEKNASRVRATVVESRKRTHLQGEVRRTVAAGSAVYTDALGSYRGLRVDYVHGFVDHAERYVEGHVHTNGIENFWSLLKRTLGGTYVSVEPFHLFRYLDEQAYRFNTRDVADGARFARLVGKAAGKRLTYNELTGAAAES